MRRTLPALVLLVLVGCVPAPDNDPPARPQPATDEPNSPTHAAVVFDGHLLCLGKGGETAAWDVKKWEYAKDVGKRFTLKGMVALETDGEKLWAADGGTLFRWSAKTNEWEKLATFDADKESVVAVVPVGGVAFVVFPSKVIDPVGKKTFNAPKSWRPLGGPPHRILATHGTDSMLWIGTGNGEWGGELFGLDSKTEKWVEGNGSGYVTGITHSEKAELIVSWSMSHFTAHTQIQIHKADGEVKTKHDRIEDKYFQRLAYSKHDEALYGIESDELVTIKDGKPTKVAKLQGDVLEREPNAMGAAPGIRDVIPVGQDGRSCPQEWRALVGPKGRRDAAEEAVTVTPGSPPR